jgi:hypothetical protein
MIVQIYAIVLVPPISFGLNRLFEPIGAPGIRPLDAVEGKNRTRWRAAAAESRQLLLVSFCSGDERRT